ncbi:MAG: O-antigen ligase family protein [Verrucomicrobiota bacterium]
MYKGERAQHLLRVWARWIVVVAVVLSPWLFGSAEPWAYLLICPLINLGTALWLLSFTGALGPRPALGPAAPAAAALVGLLLLQMVPLPRPLVAAASPRAATAQLERNRVFDAVAAQPAARDTVPGRRALSLSASPAATRHALYILIACVGVFAVLSSIRRKKQLRALTRLVVISSFLLAVFAIVQRLSGTGAIYWCRDPHLRLAGRFFGPFTNRNHYAAYMNMAFGLALAALLSRRRSTSLPGSAEMGSSKDTGNPSPDLGKAMLWGFAAALMAGSVCLSLSRGGLASLALALGLVGALPATRRVLPKRGHVIGVVTLLALAIVVWLGWEPVIRRLGTLALLTTDPLRNTRALATLATLRAWAASPWVGSGFGCFQYVFPIFQPVELPSGRFLHAHNDYAELLAEGGIAGALLALWLAWVLVRTLRARFRTASSEGRLFVCGALVGVLAIAIHSTVDFSLHKPANALVLTLLCGLSFAAARATGYESSTEPSASKPLSRRAARRLAVLGIVALGFLSALQGQEFLSEMAYARFRQWLQIAQRTVGTSQVTAAVEGACDEAELVMRHGQGNADTLLEVSAAGLRWLGNAAVKPATRVRLASEADRAVWGAAASAPSGYESWLWLGRAEAVMGRKAAARLCLERAWQLAPAGTTFEKLP